MKIANSITLFNVDELVPLDNLLRRDVTDDYIRELSKAIREQGLLHPILVREKDGKKQIIAGYCRWLAHKWMARETIPGRLVEAEQHELRTMAATENLQRVDLDPLEEALACKSMIEIDGHSVKSLSQAITKSTGWIQTRLDTLHWPQNFLECLGEKRLSMSALAELARIHDDEYRDYLLQIAIDNGVTSMVCRMWKNSWEMTRIKKKKEDLPLQVPKINAQPAKITMVCWACETDRPSGDITYEPLCSGCIDILKSARSEPVNQEI